LHNLIIALHGYEGNHKVYPPAMLADHHMYKKVQGNNGTSELPGFYGTSEHDPAWAWTGFLLPNIEQKPVYDTLQISQIRARDAMQLAFAATPNTAMQQAFQSPIGVLLCPSDTSNGKGLVVNFSNANKADPAHRTRNVWGNGEARATIQSNYVGVNRGGPIGNPRVSIVQDASWNQSGVFRINSATTLSQIIDGGSNTLFIGERATEYTNRVGSIGQVVTPWGGLALMAGGSDATIADNNCPANLSCGLSDVTSPVGRVPLNSGTNANFTNSSLHPGGCQFALGDGKVTFVSDNIDLAAFGNLGGIADRKPVKVP
jgi:hypothetical protein